MASSLTLIFLILSLTTLTVLAKVVIEEGYTVTTVVDGNKLGIYPHSVLPVYGSSDLIILDSTGSAFYTLLFSKTLESEIKKFAGGVFGYADGILNSSMFKHPKSFAMDFKGNVYVADRDNHAIRKVSNSGVTTISGGYSLLPGRSDGPARNASFSDDFEVSFIPERCALMISDHGNRLIRQINLNNEDCNKSSQSGLGMSASWVALAVVFTCIISLVVGFVARPYILTHRGRKQICFNHYTATHQMKEVQIVCSWIRSVCVSVAQLTFVKKLVYLSLSQLSLMFRPKVVNKTARQKSVSLLDSDHVSSLTSFVEESSKLSSIVSEQLKSLIPLDGGINVSEIEYQNF